MGFNQLKFYLATRVLEGKMTLDKAEFIHKKIGNKKIPEDIESICRDLVDASDDYDRLRLVK